MRSTRRQRGSGDTLHGRSRRRVVLADDDPVEARWIRLVPELDDVDGPGSGGQSWSRVLWPQDDSIEHRERPTSCRVLLDDQPVAAICRLAQERDGNRRGPELDFLFPAE